MQFSVYAFIKEHFCSWISAKPIGSESDDICESVCIEITAEFDGIDEGVVNGVGGGVYYEIRIGCVGIVVFAPLNDGGVEMLFPDSILYFRK